MEIFDPTQWEDKPTQKRKAPLSSNGQISDAERVKWCISELKSSGIDITKDYADWIKLGFSFAALGVE